MFDLGIDTKLRGCDIVKIKIGDLVSDRQVRSRAIVVQQKAAMAGLASQSMARAVDDALLANWVESRLAWLIEDGAERSDALIALAVALETKTPNALVIDMVEEGLSAGTQTALMAHLRLRGSGKRALFLMTRSSSILDLDALCRAEAVILCPANHSPPLHVVPYPGGRGYEAIATCVASPKVRARTAGVVAIRPHAN